MTILEEIAVSEQIKTLCASVKKPGRVSALFGVHKIHRTVAAAAFAMASCRPVIFVCDNDGDAYRAHCTWESSQGTAESDLLFS